MFLDKVFPVYFIYAMALARVRSPEKNLNCFQFEATQNIFLSFHQIYGSHQEGKVLNCFQFEVTPRIFLSFLEFHGSQQEGTVFSTIRAFL